MVQAANPGPGAVAPDGHALRRPDGWESPPSLGWLNEKTAGLSTDGQRGSPGVKIGPGTAIWDSRKAAKTLGEARGSRKPR